MIKRIDVTSQTSAPTPDGHVKRPRPHGDWNQGVGRSRRVDPGKTYRVPRTQKTQVAYVLEGQDATITHTSGGKTPSTGHSDARDSIWSQARKPR